MDGFNQQKPAAAVDSPVPVMSTLPTIGDTIEHLVAAQNASRVGAVAANACSQPLAQTPNVLERQPVGLTQGGHGGNGSMMPPQMFGALRNQYPDAWTSPFLAQNDGRLQMPAAQMPVSRPQMPVSRPQMPASWPQRPAEIIDLTSPRLSNSGPYPGAYAAQPGSQGQRAYPPVARQSASTSNHGPPFPGTCAAQPSSQGQRAFPPVARPTASTSNYGPPYPGTNGAHHNMPAPPRPIAPAMPPPPRPSVPPMPPMPTLSGPLPSKWFGSNDLEPKRIGFMHGLDLKADPEVRSVRCEELPEPHVTEYYDICRTIGARCPVVVRKTDMVVGSLLQGVILVAGGANSDNPVKARWSQSKQEWCFCLHLSNMRHIKLDLKAFQRQMEQHHRQGDRKGVGRVWSEWDRRIKQARAARTEDHLIVMERLRMFVQEQQASVVQNGPRWVMADGQAVLVGAQGDRLLQGGPSLGVMDPASIRAGSNAVPEIGVPGPAPATNEEDEEFVDAPDGPSVMSRLLPSSTGTDGTMRPDEMHIRSGPPVRFTPDQHAWYVSTARQTAAQNEQLDQEWPHRRDRAERTDSVVPLPRPGR